MGRHRRRRRRQGRISFYNSERYADPTACLALRSIQREERRTQKPGSIHAEQPIIRVEHYPPRNAAKA